MFHSSYNWRTLLTAHNKPSVSKFIRKTDLSDLLDVLTLSFIELIYKLLLVFKFKFLDFGFIDISFRQLFFWEEHLLFQHRKYCLSEYKNLE